MKRSLICAVLALPLVAAPVLAHEVLHAGHEGHLHAKGCGHQAIDHGGHVDYLHDGHLHHAHDGHVDEHVIEVSDANPDAEELATRLAGDAHAGAGQVTVQHGDHIDFVHDGRLHHQHGDHFDDHGALKFVAS